MSASTGTLMQMSTIIEWLSRQPNWIWLLVVALITHRLTLRREKWNREQARRNDQRKVVADFSATVNSVAPAAADLATWLQRRRTADNPEDFDQANQKVDDALEAFAENVFEVHRVADLLKMTLVDPELSYRASFALKLAQDFTEVGGDRRSDPSAESFSLSLLERRCTVRLKELMGATDELVKAAISRVQPQTSWFQKRVAAAHFRDKIRELKAFSDSIDVDTAQTFSTTTKDLERPEFPRPDGAVHPTGSSVSLEHPPGVRERTERAEDGSEIRVRLTRVLGRDLDSTYVGRRIGRYRGGYNRVGRLVDVSPDAVGSNGARQVTVDWTLTSTAAPDIETLTVGHDDAVDFVEVIG